MIARGRTRAMRTGENVTRVQGGERNTWFVRARGARRGIRGAMTGAKGSWRSGTGPGRRTRGSGTRRGARAFTERCRGTWRTANTDHRGGLCPAAGQRYISSGIEVPPTRCRPRTTGFFMSVSSPFYPRKADHSDRRFYSSCHPRDKDAGATGITKSRGGGI